jgi:hypothetical protein
MNDGSLFKRLDRQLWELPGYALVSSRKVQQVDKPKILFTTRSLRSLESTEITEKIKMSSVSSVVQAFDLDRSSTGI